MTIKMIKTSRNEILAAFADVRITCQLIVIDVTKIKLIHTSLVHRNAEGGNEGIAITIIRIPMAMAVEVIITVRRKSHGGKRSSEATGVMVGTPIIENTRMY